MTDIIAKKSEFDIIVTKVGDRIQVTDPISIKNQIQEIHSIDNLGLNTASRTDGSLVTWNSNTGLYDVKPFDTYKAFSWNNIHSFNANIVFNSGVLANNNPGISGQFLTSNGQGVYWSNATPLYTFGSGLSINALTVSVNSSYIATISSNNATYAFGKTEANLNVNSAVYSANALFANSAAYFGGQIPTYYASNSSLANYYLASNPAGYITSSANITGSANSSTYLGGKLEANLNVNNAIYSTNASFAYMANNTTYVNNKSEINLNVNNAIYSTNATFAYNSNTLNGQPASYYTNATNIVTGTLAEPRLPYRMNQDVTNSANVQFKNLVLTGTLSIANGVTSITANNFSITDNMFYLNNGVLAGITDISGNGSVITFTANNNFSTGWDVVVTDVNPTSYNGTYLNILFSNATHFQVANTNTDAYVSGGSARGKSDVNPDLGFAAGYNDGTYHHAGFFRDHNNGTWKVFDSYIPEPDISVYIDQTHPSFRLSNFMANNVFVGNNTVFATITPTNFSGTSNNATYLGDKTETNLNVNSAIYSTNATFAYTANNTTYVNNKTEANLNVNNAITANNSTYLGDKTETNLNVNSAIYSTNANFAYTANTTTYVNNKTEVNLNVNSSVYSTNATFAYTANSATYLGGQPVSSLNVNSAVYSTNSNFAYNSNTLNSQPGSYYTNATNMSTGTLAEPRLPYRMDQDVTSTANVQFRNLTLSGTLLIANGVTSITANNFAITDNMFYLNNGVLATITNVSGNGSVVTFTANNNFSTGWDVVVTDVNPTSYNGDYLNILFANATHFQVANTNTASYVTGGYARGKSDINPDLGFAAGYNDGTYHHTGFFRDHTNGTWKVFDNYTPEPDNSIYIDQTDASFHLANFMANTIFVGNNTVYSTITSTNFSGSANNTTYVNNKTEANLNVNSAVYSTNSTFAFTANNSLYANNSTYLGGKTESNLNVNAAVYSTNASFAFTANNTTYFNGYTWNSPAAIGGTTANSANFTTVNATSYTVGTSFIANSNYLLTTGQVRIANAGISAASWATNGIGLIQSAATFTDNSTPASNTVPTAYMNLFDTQTYAASNTGVTVSNLYGTYFKNPVAGTNVTATNRYALVADSIYSVGAFFVGGAMTVSSTITHNGGTANIVTVTNGGTVNIAAGATTSGLTKTVNIGTNGLSGSNTNITVGSTFGTTTTFNGNTSFTGPVAINNVFQPGVVTINAASVSSITPIAGNTNHNNIYYINTTPTINQPSGAPHADAQKLMLRLKDAGTANTLTWNVSPGSTSSTTAGFRPMATSNVALPSTTIAGKVTYVACVYNALDFYWDVVGVSNQ